MRLAETSRPPVRGTGRWIGRIAGLGVGFSYQLRAPRGMLAALAVACIAWVNVDTVRRVGVDRAFDVQLDRAAVGLALS